MRRDNKSMHHTQRKRERERKVGRGMRYMLLLLLLWEGRGWNWMIPDLWLYISVVSDLSRRYGRAGACRLSRPMYSDFGYCHYHCRIINEYIRSISSPIQPTSLVGSALARLKTVTYPYRHHRPYRMKFGFHHQQVTRNHQLRWMLFYPRFYPWYVIAIERNI